MKHLFKCVITAIISLSANPALSADISEYQTQLANISSQPTIVIRISDDAVIKQDVEQIIDWLESQITTGVKFKAGQSLQIGSVNNRLSALKDGRLILEEPDMQSFPIEYIATMNHTFNMMRAQKDTVESINQDLPLSFALLEHAIAVHTDYKTAPSVLLERVRPAGNLTGWWLHTKADADPNEFSYISIYQFALDRPDLVKFLALPQGSKVFNIAQAPLRITINEQEVSILEDSFLGKLQSLR